MTMTPAYKYIDNDIFTVIYNRLSQERVNESDFNNRDKIIKSVWFTHRQLIGELPNRRFVPTFTIIVRFNVRTKEITWEFDDDASYEKCKELAMVAKLNNIFGKPFN